MHECEGEGVCVMTCATGGNTRLSARGATCRLLYEYMQLFSVVCLLKASQFLALERLTKVASASRTRVVLSLNEATIRVRVRRFDCDGFVIDEVLCDRFKTSYSH